MRYFQYPPYIPVAEKRARAEKKIRQLKKKNPDLQPVIIEGRTLARTWWGKSWNANLERYADYSNRIGRGRSYVRHMAVLDLQTGRGKVDALVQGSASKPYRVEIRIKALAKSHWQTITAACAGQLDSLQDLLAGRFPERLSHLFMQKGSGLFPSPDEIQFACSCPDWAYMCKHVAAVLYGIGARLDEDPSLFFALRQVNVDELIAKAVQETSEQWIEKAEETATPTIAEADLGAVFGIDMDAVSEFKKTSMEKRKTTARQKAKKTVPQTGKPSGPKVSSQPVDEKTRILDLVNAAPDGITAGQLHQQSGIPMVKIRNVLFQAFQKGDLQRVSRGVYRAARPLPATVAEREAAILNLVDASPKGVRAPEMAAATGLSVSAVRPVLSRLVASDKIRRISRGIYGPAARRSSTTLTDEIDAIIAAHPKGVSAGELTQQSGRDEKQVRNVLFRLFKAGKIRRVGRGIYAAARQKQR